MSTTFQNGYGSITLDDGNTPSISDSSNPVSASLGFSYNHWDTGPNKGSTVVITYDAQITTSEDDFEISNITFSPSASEASKTASSIGLYQGSGTITFNIKYKGANWNRTITNAITITFTISYSSTSSWGSSQGAPKSISTTLNVTLGAGPTFASGTVFTVELDANGGQFYDEVTIRTLNTTDTKFGPGSTAWELPVRNGYEFVGWEIVS